MNRITIACYAMIASCFVLAGLLTVQIAQHAESVANAEMVIAKGDLSILSTQGVNQDEYVYVLDHRSQKMLMYSQTARGDIEPLGFLDVGQEFAQRYAAGAGTGGNTRKSR
ncbi:MAG: hypothetical protein WC058_10835 [Phycisphaeraceae bacterium]